MLRKFRSHLTYANVVSTLCLFILLGGSAYAAAKITGKNVKNGSLTGKDLKNNSVTGKDVKSLGAKDFKAGDLPTGPKGATGARGSTGPKGRSGAAGSPAASFLGGRSEFQDGNGTAYGPPIGAASFTAQASDVDMVSPSRPIVARDLFVRADSVPRDARTFSLSVNGADSALKCTLSVSASPSSCSDAADAVLIPAGSTIVLHESNHSSGGTNLAIPFRYGWRATSP